MEQRCTICFKKFERYHLGKYCSYKCRNKGYIKRTVTICTCGKEFFSAPYQKKKGAGKFCSRKCASDANKGPKKIIDEYLSKYRKKNAILQWHKSQGRNKCQIKNCDWNLTLDLHRLNPGKNGGEYTRENTILLCPNHHTTITRKIKSYGELMDGSVV